MLHKTFSNLCNSRFPRIIHKTTCLKTCILPNVFKSFPHNRCITWKIFKINGVYIKLLTMLVDNSVEKSIPFFVLYIHGILWYNIHIKNERI